MQHISHTIFTKIYAISTKKCAKYVLGHKIHILHILCTKIVHCLKNYENKNQNDFFLKFDEFDNILLCSGIIACRQQIIKSRLIDFQINI